MVRVTLKNGARVTLGGAFWPNNVNQSLRHECYFNGIDIPNQCQTDHDLMELLTLYAPDGFYFGTLSVQGAKEYGWWVIDKEKTDMVALHTEY